MDIKLFSTDELVDELVGRFDAVVFMGQQYGVYEKNDIVKKFVHKGSLDVCSGMCNRMAYVLNLKWDKIETPTKEQ